MFPETESKQEKKLPSEGLISEIKDSTLTSNFFSLPNI